MDWTTAAAFGYFTQGAGMPNPAAMYHHQAPSSTTAEEFLQQQQQQAEKPTIMSLDDKPQVTSTTDLKPKVEYGDGGAYGTPVSGADMYGAGGVDPTTAAAAMGHFFGYPTVGGAAGMMLAAGGRGELEDEQLKRQKEVIYSHPLYPLLCCLFEKCELATCSPREPSRDGSSDAQKNVCSSGSFKEDLEAFVKVVQDKKPYFVPNPEVDSLMLSAIQVLRVHLLELEKVHELCDNFCHRYVDNIKAKMPMEMSGEERASSTQPTSSSGHSPAGNIQGGGRHSSAMPSPGAATGGMNTPMQCPSYPPYEPQSVPLPESASAMAPQQQQQQPMMNEGHVGTSAGFLDLSNMNSSCSSASTTSGATPNPGGETPDAQQYSSHHQQQHPLGHGGANPQQQQTTADGTMPPQQQYPPHQADGSSNGSSSTSSAAGSHHSNAAPPQNGNNAQQAVADSSTNHVTPDRSAPPETPNSQTHHGLESISDGDLGEEAFSTCGSLPEDGRESVSSEGGGANGTGNGANASLNSNGKRKVPKVFSKEAITKFRSWLFHNLTHPYPSEEQKKQLAQDTGLTILQVNNWFINARRRIVQPMIDSNNRAGRSPQVNVFKNRRRKNSGSSPSGTSPDNGTSTTPTYSPENMQVMNAMAASAGAQVYPPAAAMFAANPYASAMPGFPPAFPGFMPGMGAMMNPYGMATGAPTGWLDLGAGPLGQMDSSS